MKTRFICKRSRLCLCMCECVCVRCTYFSFVEWETVRFFRYIMYVSSEIDELTLERLVWLNVWVVSSARICSCCFFENLYHIGITFYTFLSFPFLSLERAINVFVCLPSAKFYTTTSLSILYRFSLKRAENEIKSRREQITVSHTAWFLVSLFTSATTYIYR